MDNKAIQSDTAIDIFKPDPEMQLWLDTAIELKTNEKTKISAACSIDRLKWYRTWRKKPGFLDWYLKEWNKGIREHGPELDEIGFNKAKHDFKFWESMQKRVGNLTNDKTLIQNNMILEIVQDEA